MEKKLSKDAYGGVEGSQYKPYISKDHGLKELTTQVFIVGILLAVLFAASNAYAAITAGMTVAAGIPGAILGGGILAAIMKKTNALNTNIVQGMSSAGESIASGITFVLPAVFILGLETETNLFVMMLVGIAGVLLGIAVTSLVHNYLIVEEHGKLVYPEGMAISETVVSTDAGGDGLKTMMKGFGIGAFFVAISTQISGLVSTTFSVEGVDSYKWQWQTDANPLLLGIGFIVGIEVAAVMLAGTVLANIAIIPLIGYFTQYVDPSITAWNNPDLALVDMTAGDIQGTFTKYIGAGMMLAGGIIGAIKLIPVIISSVKEAVSGGKGASSIEGKDYKGLLLLVGGVLLVISSIFISSGILMAIVAVILIILFSFLFSIVAARMTGDIGTSNLPVSGMTIASLLIVTVTFVIMGNITGVEDWTNSAGNLTILLALTAVVTAIAISGGYAQTQKATYIIGGNKSTIQKLYSIAAVVGVIATVLVCILLAPMYTQDPGMAPQANLMASITDGILSGNLPWTIIAVGVVMAIVVFILDLPIMTVALGFYLPVGTVSIIFIGAILKVIMQKMTADKEHLEAKEERGTIFSSGLIAGGAITGLVGAGLAIFAPDGALSNYFFYVGGDEPLLSGNGFALIAITALALISYFYINSAPKKDTK